MFLLRKLQIQQRANRSSSALGGRGQQVSLTAQLLLFNCLVQFHGTPPAVQMLVWEMSVFKPHLNVYYLTPDSKRML